MPRRDQIAHAERICGTVRDAVPETAPAIDQRLLKSWQRSLESYRLDPGRTAEPRILTASGLRDHQEPLESFLRIARHGVRRLHEQVCEANYVVLLTDAQGVTIDFMGVPALDAELRHAGLYLGSCWSEREEGTCGVGTAITDCQPITVHKTEHFRAPNITLTCSAAPLFAADGSLLAILDGSALYSPDDRSSQALVFRLVQQHALLIEDAYFLDQARDAWVLQFSASIEFLDVRTDYLIAFDDLGWVRAANRRARTDFFGGRAPQRARVEGIFDATAEDLVRMGLGKPGFSFPLRARDGLSLYFGRLRAPERPRSPLSSPREPAPVQAPRSSAPAAMGLADLALGDPGMQDTARRAARLVDCKIPILLQGETGCGKEAFARALHAASARRDKPFVAVNCAAIPETLIESELFGYREGAFTGARAKGMKGKIQQSSGGTLFLDEIGDMPYPLQSRLLRVLAEQEVLPLGAEEPVPVDLHVVCATHRDLPEMVRDGRFREDLFFRLNAATFALPPLRRRMDIADLVHKVFAEEAVALGRCLELDESALERLCAYAWPGNIRELRNAMRYACAVCDGPRVGPRDLPASLQLTVGAARSAGVRSGWTDLEESRAGDQRLRGECLAVLRRNRWNAAASARELGIARATLYRRMARFGIVPPNRADAG